jgi:hypothetical protein
MPSRRNLTLIELMAAVGAAALGLAWVASTAPGRAGPALIVIGPLVGILCDRWRGGTGHTRRGSGWGGVCRRRADQAGRRPTRARLAGTPVDGELTDSSSHNDGRMPHVRHAHGRPGMARGGCDGTIGSPPPVRTQMTDSCTVFCAGVPSIPNRTPLGGQWGFLRAFNVWSARVRPRPPADRQVSPFPTCQSNVGNMLGPNPASPSFAYRRPFESLPIYSPLARNTMFGPLRA